MSIDLRHEPILVTGATGFLGKHLVKHLSLTGHDNVDAFGERHFDLVNQDQVYDLFNSYRPDYVFHLAGYNGGISFNAANAADIFYRNTVMGLNVLQACAEYRVKKIVSVVASCAYPDADYYGEDFYEHVVMPSPIHYGVLEEHELLRGRPNPSVACHGYAKRNLQLASQFYRRQYGLRAVTVCPTTLYGPGDSYDPERTKVLGSMVKRFVDAVANGEQEVTCWGSGRPQREFLYVEDCAKLLVAAMQRYEDSEDTLNLGSGQEMTVREVAETIARCVEFSGSISWDTTRPDGQMRKRLDSLRMKELFGPELTKLTPFEEGARRTIEDYRARQERGTT